MTRKRWLAVIGAIGTAAAATGCDPSVRGYLKKGGLMHVWQSQVGEAVCQLEEHNPAGLDPAKRICPNGRGGSGDVTPPPSYGK